MQRLRLLVSRPAARREERAFVVEGPKLLGEAVAAGARVLAVYIEGGAHGALADRTGAPVYDVAPEVLRRACDTVAPQPVAAIVEMVDVPLPAVRERGLVVVCAGLQDPGNAGTVIRSAAASGAGAVVFPAGAVDFYNPKAVRASAGAVFQIPLTAGPGPDEVLEQLGAWGLHRVGTAPRAGRDYATADLTGPVALVLGGEARGLTAELDRCIDERVTIPMAPGSESLNVAMAATVICFEAARQRRAAA